MIDILFHVSTEGGARLLDPLARACTRSGRSFAAFFTHIGVMGLRGRALEGALAPATRVAVCEESWHRFCPGIECPVELGSQTVNSALAGEARRVVSL